MSKSDIQTGGELQLGGQFTVILDGKDLGAPPSSAVAVLLLVLAFNNDWVARAELESKLHPNPDKRARGNSFRQTLFRLKKWIGADHVRVESRRIRLTAPWLLRVANRSGELVAASRIAAGIDHPWLDEIRHEFAVKFGAVGGSDQAHFLSLLQALKENDTETGRALLTSGAHLLEAHSQSDVLNIFSAFRPRRGMEVYSAEFYLQRSQCAMRFGSFDSAEDYALRALRIAQKKRQSAVSAQSAAYLMFCLLEKGDESASVGWLETLKKMERTPLTRTLVKNAEFAYFWNSGDYEQASFVMRVVEENLTKSTRLEQLHFWTNASLFFAEVGNPDSTLECIRNAESLIRPSLDISSHQVLELSRILINTSEGKYKELLEKIQQLVTLCDVQEFPLNAVYAMAEYSRLLAKMGKTMDARKVWREVESRRRSFGGGLPERVKRQRAELQIF